MARHVAVIADNRRDQVLLHVIRHFRSRLPKYEWAIIFICGIEHAEHYKSTLDGLGITIKPTLPCVFGLNEYNDLFKSLSFWESIPGDPEFVLVFQMDAFLCQQSPYSIEHFFQYDYVGGYAPQSWWSKELKVEGLSPQLQCINGGLSLRRLSSMLEVVKNFPPQPTQEYLPGMSDFRCFAEDVYFYIGMTKMGRPVASDNFSRAFCTHSAWTGIRTFGCHKFFHYLSYQSMREFLTYSPESLAIVPSGVIGWKTRLYIKFIHLLHKVSTTNVKSNANV
ncbi:MAG: hypothetical protein K9K86_00600 [Pseudomonadales bacterium]|nr:hypothetical protein [Pseudomonadales bacterium]MCF8014250.1 hypothetical protein [Chromatiaceae bacterium]